MSEQTTTLDVATTSRRDVTKALAAVGAEVTNYTQTPGAVGYTTITVAAPTVWVAVVDWHSDGGESPDVFVATAEDAARLAGMRCVANYAGALRAMEDHEAREYVEENPAPAEDADADTVAAWYEGWHEETTDGWVTVTSEQVHQ